MSSRTIERRNGKKPSETVGWSQEDIELVERNRRAAMEEWDDIDEMLDVPAPAFIDNGTRMPNPSRTLQSSEVLRAIGNPLRRHSTPTTLTSC
ncbi:MAG: hypothetical protein CL569_11740 [Alphaproteobacteria bacterium]|nr:hypothetical protein [Alphaproteobacteria bacterium]|tara:strand:+ start:483 stop:761 length:279 start_codon:yes stop_codon:yes gene_type:complete